jgi:hypothetical protein
VYAIARIKRSTGIHLCCAESGGTLDRPVAARASVGTVRTGDAGEYDEIERVSRPAQRSPASGSNAIWLADGWRARMVGGVFDPASESPLFPGTGNA